MMKYRSPAARTAILHCKGGPMKDRRSPRGGAGVQLEIEEGLNEREPSLGESIFEQLRTTANDFGRCPGALLCEEATDMIVELMKLTPSLPRPQLFFPITGDIHAQWVFDAMIWTMIQTPYGVIAEKVRKSDGFKEAQRFSSFRQAKECSKWLFACNPDKTDA